MSSTQPRYPAHLRVALASEGPSDETTNVSAGGMFVRTDRELPVGTTLSVGLELPDDQRPTPVKVKIVHAVAPRAHSASSERGVGMQFVAADDVFRQRIERYLQSIAAKASAPIRVLLVARDLLHESGWAQLDAHDSAGRYCLSGALAKAAGEERAPHPAPFHPFGERLHEAPFALRGFDCPCAILRRNERPGPTPRRGGGK